MNVFANPCPWYVAGPLLGLLVTGLLWTINKPLGALGGYVDTAKWLVEREQPGPTWRVAFLPGIVIGGALSALAAGAWQGTSSYGAFTSSFGAILGSGGVVLLAAGMLVGFGAPLGGGCTSGHGMCGTAFGSPASIVCTMTFMGTAIVVAHLLAAAIGSGS
ncbi:MAG TPA: YeeE/YedE thiosulfate transporter family protein [Casimicrobiaceae bacterium]|nr:YeeE/YedE thiosulfate transporter family protein [Casimicrobiaceae bacterium]